MDHTSFSEKISEFLINKKFTVEDNIALKYLNKDEAFIIKRCDEYDNENGIYFEFRYLISKIEHLLLTAYCTDDSDFIQLMNSTFNV